MHEVGAEDALVALRGQLEGLLAGRSSPPLRIRRQPLRAKAGRREPNEYSTEISFKGPVFKVIGFVGGAGIFDRLWTGGRTSPSWMGR
ncbi:hypothetical protein [Mycobacteroides abscessus]|uniref:hypothetical protein n=1 Tax=Mycobacteroides abscessus TaxID=36809 RepID=UPI001055D4E8|nr:hypothetical protein [Mycobacteroides abscessus]